MVDPAAELWRSSSDRVLTSLGQNVGLTCGFVDKTIPSLTASLPAANLPMTTPPSNEAHETVLVVGIGIISLAHLTPVGHFQKRSGRFGLEHVNEPARILTESPE